MDNFHGYLKKQLLDYVEQERARGVPLDAIERVLLDAGHHRDIVDEVFHELQHEQAGLPTEQHKGVEGDLVSQLKGAFSQFMAQASSKEVEAAKKDFKKTDTKKLVEEVIDEAEVIEEKTMMESAVFFIYLIGMGAVLLFTAGATGTQISNVFIGFLPAILNAFISFLGLKLADNVPLYMFIPLTISAAFYAVGMFGDMPLFARLDVESLAIVNFLFGFFFNVLIVYVRFMKPKHMRRRVIKKDRPRRHMSMQEPQEIQELRRDFA